MKLCFNNVKTILTSEACDINFSNIKHLSSVYINPATRITYTTFHERCLFSRNNWKCTNSQLRFSPQNKIF